VWNMLGNLVYVGEVQSRGKRYPGLHDAIVTQQLWDNVQALRAQRTRAKVVQLHKTDLLRDLMYDSFGRKMGVFRDYRYAEVRRYYISNQSEWGRRHGVRRYRTKADPLERLVVAAITTMLSNREQLRAMLLRLGIHDKSLNKLTAAGGVAARRFDTVSIRQSQRALKALIERIELSSTLIKIVIRTPELPRYLSWDGVGFFSGDTDAWGRPHITDVIDVPANTICMKRELTLLLKRTQASTSAKPNRSLIGLLKRARLAQAALDDREVYHPNELAARIHCHPKRFTHLVRLNYLAPDIIASILDGTQPPALTAKSIMAANLPMDWALQRRLLGFPDQPDFLKAAPGW
jgi:site-specific DNA recombinase